MFDGACELLCPASQSDKNTFIFAVEDDDADATAAQQGGSSAGPADKAAFKLQVIVPAIIVSRQASPDVAPETNAQFTTAKFNYLASDIMARPQLSHELVRLSSCHILSPVHELQYCWQLVQHFSGQL